MTSKTVTLTLRLESDYESTIYDAVGGLLSHIEENGVFDVDDVKVTDTPVITIPPSQHRGLKDIGRRTYND